MKYKPPDEAAGLLLIPEFRFSLVSFMYVARISDEASFAVSIKIFSFVSLNQIITKRI